MKKSLQEFQKTVQDYYQAHGRHDLPWRLFADTPDPYHVLVSEVMLQQTQVSRVIPKYEAFLELFPTIADLAHAELGDVLRAWQGLGYNRRAKFLWLAATELHGSHRFPDHIEALQTLPGIGANTAAAIVVYAFDKPAVFIETNIRTVYIHHFLSNQTDVADSIIRELVARTLPEQSYREWFWALMDYGTYLKQTHGNLSTQSKAYNKQSRFSGSKRQIRGAVLKQLAGQPATAVALRAVIKDERLSTVLYELEQEGLIRRNASRYML